MFGPSKLFIYTITILLFVNVGLATSSPALPPPVFSKQTTKEATNPVLLANETFRRGIYFQHLQQSKGLNSLSDTIGNGACVFDFNNDNFTDIYFVAGAGATRFYGRQHWWSQQAQGALYQNDGHGYFKLVLTDTGLPNLKEGLGCNTADLDNDGQIDLIINGRGESWIAYGDGHGKFRSIQLEQSVNWTNSASIIDVNNDGLLDIYLSNYIKYKRNDKTLEVNTGFKDSSSTFQPENFPAQENTLYLNEGNRIFTDNTKNYNLSNSDGRSIGSHWLNANNDEWPDLLVLNDSGSETQLLINNHGEYFSPAPLSKQFTSLSSVRSSNTFTFNDNTKQAITVFSTKIGSSPYFISQTDNKNINLTWEKIQGTDKLEGREHWGIASTDLNGDGLLDLYMGSGLVIPNEDAPRIPQGQADTVLIQNKNGLLYNQDYERHITLSTRAVITSDIDNDGDSDLILTHNNGPAMLKINNSNPEYWIGLDIRNKNNQTNRYRIIKLSQNGQEYWLHPKQDGYLSNNDHRQLLTFSNDTNISVEVIWPDGKKNKYTNLKLGHYHELHKNNDKSKSLISSNLQPLKSIPIDLIIWKIKSGKIQTKNIIFTFENSSNAHQNLILRTAYEAKRYSLALALIETAQNNDIHLNSTSEIIKELEFEISIPLVLNEIENNLNCATTHIIETWFTEEESMVLSKKMLIRPLLRKLAASPPKVQTCILMALSESRQFRPVTAIENLLIDSQSTEVKKAAIYSLGKLRRTRSIPLIKSYLDQPEFSEEAKSALNRLNSKVAVDKPVFHPQAKTAKNNIANIIRTPPCPRFDIKKAVNLKQNELATILSLCSNSSLKSWLIKNKLELIKHIDVFINNPKLNIQQINAIIETVKDQKIEGMELLLSGRLNQTQSIELKTVILKSLSLYSHTKVVQISASKILVNKDFPKSLRIAAGNLLIDIKPNLVMAHSDSIFHE